MYFPLSKFELTCFDNEGEGEGNQEAGNGAEGEAGKGEGEGENKKERTFTQDQVNKMMGNRTKALNEKLAALESTYTELLEQTNLTEAQRDKLEGELEAVQAQMRTKEQQAEYEQKKAQTKFESELAAAKEEGTKYKNLFETSITKRAITDAAMANDGCNAEDFIAHLAPRTKVVIELDSEGQKTGNLVPMVDWDVKDDNGVVTRVSKTPDEVVKLMQEMPERYGHLFRANVAQGIGAGTAKASPSLSGKIDQKKISDAEYFELSKTPEGRRALGLAN